MTSPPSLEGCNTSERALLWAMAEFGGSTSMTESLDADARSAIEPAASEVLELSAARRAEVAEAWRADSPALERRLRHADRDAIRRLRSGFSTRWKVAIDAIVADRAGTMRPAVRNYVARVAAGKLDESGVTAPMSLVADGFDFGAVVDMTPADLESLLVEIGLFQLAEIYRKRGRRAVARVLKELPAGSRDRLRAFLAEERSFEDGEQEIIRDAFLAVSKRHDDVVDRLRHMGMYFLAFAAGSRMTDVVEGLAGRLSGTDGAALVDYHRVAIESTRRGLATVVRRSLATLMEDADE